MALVHMEAEAIDRLSDLGLTTHMIHRSLLRADAEAALVTALEPATAEGIARYSKTTRFLREELLPFGWTHTNANNFCRTFNPDGTIALVASSGDSGAGMVLPGQNPSTKYPKGETTVRAVAANQQLTLDFGDDFADESRLDATIAIWYLLYQVKGHMIYCELSLPASIENGYIETWSERIILPPIERTGSPISSSGTDEGDGDRYEVNVARRA